MEVSKSKAASSLESIFLSPTSQDILLGRGKPYQSHPGNERMRQIVEQHKERYDSLPRERRGIVANDILQIIEDSGARFLKIYSGRGNDVAKVAMTGSQDIPKFLGRYWVLAPKAEAYEKVCHALRWKRKSRLGGSGNDEEGKAYARQMQLKSKQKFHGGYKAATKADDDASPSCTKKPAFNDDNSFSPRIREHVGGTDPNSEQGPVKQEKSNRPESWTKSEKTETAIYDRSDLKSDEDQSSGSSYKDIAIMMAIEKYLGKRQSK